MFLLKVWRRDRIDDFAGADRLPRSGGKDMQQTLGQDAASRCRHGDTGDAIGGFDAGGEGGPAADRLGDDGASIDSGVVHHGEYVAGEIAWVDVVDIAARAPPATVIEQDAEVALGESRNLLEPFERIAAAAVGEHHRQPVAVGLVIDGGFLGLDCRHCPSSLSARAK